MTKIKTVRGYTGLARFRRELYANPIGYIPTKIRSKFSYSATQVVWRHKETKKPIIIVESGQRKYDIYTIRESDIYKREKDAEKAYFKGR